MASAPDCTSLSRSFLPRTCRDCRARSVVWSIVQHLFCPESTRVSRGTSKNTSVKERIVAHLGTTAVGVCSPVASPSVGRHFRRSPGTVGKQVRHPRTSTNVSVHRDIAAWQVCTAGRLVRLLETDGVVHIQLSVVLDLALECDVG